MAIVRSQSVVEEEVEIDEEVAKDMREDEEVAVDTETIHLPVPKPLVSTTIIRAAAGIEVKISTYT